MRYDMRMIDDQIEREAEALARAADSLCKLADECLPQQQSFFMRKDRWDAKRDAYLKRRETAELEHYKLAILL